MSLQNSSENIKKEDTLIYLKNNIIGTRIRTFSWFLKMVTQLNANTRKLKKITDEILKEIKNFNSTKYNNLLNSTILSQYQTLERNEKRKIAIQAVLFKHSLLSTEKKKDFEKYLKKSNTSVEQIILAPPSIQNSKKNKYFQKSNTSVEQIILAPPSIQNSTKNNRDIDELCKAFIFQRNNIKALANKIDPNILQEAQNFFLGFYADLLINKLNIDKNFVDFLILQYTKYIHDVKKITILTVLLKHNLLNKEKIKEFKEYIQLLFRGIYNSKLNYSRDLNITQFYNVIMSDESYIQKWSKKININESILRNILNKYPMMKFNLQEKIYKDLVNLNNNILNSTKINNLHSELLKLESKEINYDNYKYIPVDLTFPLSEDAINILTRHELREERPYIPSINEEMSTYIKDDIISYFISTTYNKCITGIVGNYWYGPSDDLDDEHTNKLWEILEKNKNNYLNNSNESKLISIFDTYKNNKLFINNEQRKNAILIIEKIINYKILSVYFIQYINPIILLEIYNKKRKMMKILEILENNKNNFLPNSNQYMLISIFNKFKENLSLNPNYDDDFQAISLIGHIMDDIKNNTN